MWKYFLLCYYFFFLPLVFPSHNRNTWLKAFFFFFNLINAVVLESLLLLKYAIRCYVCTHSQVELVVTVDVSLLLEDERLLTCGMLCIPGEGKNRVTCHFFIPPFQGIAKYTDDTSDETLLFGVYSFGSSLSFSLGFFTLYCLPALCLLHCNLDDFLWSCSFHISANKLDEFPILWKRAEFIDIK